MTESILDQASELRSSDAFDKQKVNTWILQQGVDVVGDMQVKQFSGGASNLTYLLKYENVELIMRCPPAGHKAASAHDMHREYNTMDALKPVYPCVPDMLAFCEDHDIIGRDFYIMEKLVGIIPRKNMPRDLKISKEETRKLCLAAIDKLIELHQIDYKTAGLEGLGKGEGYVARQVGGWSGRFEKSHTWNVPKFKSVMKWLDENQPNDVMTCVIHNDFRLDNLVLDADDPTKIIGVLDWEMATLGDPLMDLGGSLAYWSQADDDYIMRQLRRQPTHLDGMLTRDEIVDYYCSKMNLPKENWAFYEVFGLFRLAVIGQQIYYRYFHKQTDNPAFKHIWALVHYCHWRCKKIIKTAAK